MVGVSRVPSRCRIGEGRIVGGGTGYMTADGLSGVEEGDMPTRMRQRKHGTSWGSPRRSRTARAPRISPQDEVAVRSQEGRMGSSKR
jgi:hypothetical protein